MILRAAELEPLALIVHQCVARSLHYAGRYEEAIDQCRRLLELDPGFVAGYEILARPLCALGRFEEAEKAAVEGVTRSGRWSLLLGALGNVYGHAGKRERALDILAELEAQAARRYVPPYHFAMVHFGLHEEESALQQVERLIAARSGVVIWLGIDPHTEWLHGIPRFRELISELKLPVVGVPASQ